MFENLWLKIKGVAVYYIPTLIATAPITTKSMLENATAAKAAGQSTLGPIAYGVVNTVACGVPDVVMAGYRFIRTKSATPAAPAAPAAPASTDATLSTDASRKVEAKDPAHVEGPR